MPRNLPTVTAPSGSKPATIKAPVSTTSGSVRPSWTINLWKGLLNPPHVHIPVKTKKGPG